MADAGRGGAVIGRGTHWQVSRRPYRDERKHKERIELLARQRPAVKRTESNTKCGRRDDKCDSGIFLFSRAAAPHGAAAAPRPRVLSGRSRFPRLLRRRCRPRCRARVPAGPRVAIKRQRKQRRLRDRHGGALLPRVRAGPRSDGPGAATVRAGPGRLRQCHNLSARLRRRLRVACGRSGLRL